MTQNARQLNSPCMRSVGTNGYDVYTQINSADSIRSVSHNSERELCVRNGVSVGLVSMSAHCTVHSQSLLAEEIGA